MENGFVRVENTDKMLAILKGLSYNNSVKFTTERGDYLETNDSMVMKMAYAQFHKHTNIMCKFQSSTCKNVGVMLWITMI